MMVKVQRCYERGQFVSQKAHSKKDGSDEGGWAAASTTLFWTIISFFTEIPTEVIGGVLAVVLMIGVFFVMIQQVKKKLWESSSEWGTPKSKKFYETHTWDTEGGVEFSTDGTYSFVGDQNVKFKKGRDPGTGLHSPSKGRNTVSFGSNVADFTQASYTSSSAKQAFTSRE
jgi:hypothetical protein